MSKTTENKTEQMQTPWLPPAGPVTYIGPDIPGVVVRMTSFTGVIPAKLLEIAREKCKAVRQLIVPMDKIAISEMATRTEGMALHTLYQTAAAFAALGEE